MEWELEDTEVPPVLDWHKAMAAKQEDGVWLPESDDCIAQSFHEMNWFLHDLSWIILPSTQRIIPKQRTALAKHSSYAYA
nr:hypothetical protein [uncultured Solibaculum sp.]